MECFVGKGFRVFFGEDTPCFFSLHLLPSFVVLVKYDLLTIVYWHIYGNKIKDVNWE